MIAFSSDFVWYLSVDASTYFPPEEVPMVLSVSVLLFVLPHPEKISVPASAIHSNAFDISWCFHSFLLIAVFYRCNVTVR